jgi:hypothetical protein
MGKLRRMVKGPVNPLGQIVTQWVGLERSKSIGVDGTRENVDAQAVGPVSNIPREVADLCIKEQIIPVGMYSRATVRNKIFHGTFYKYHGNRSSYVANSTVGPVSISCFLTDDANNLFAVATRLPLAQPETHPLARMFEQDVCPGVNSQMMFSHMAFVSPSLQVESLLLPAKDLLCRCVVVEYDVQNMWLVINYIEDFEHD